MKKNRFFIALAMTTATLALGACGNENEPEVVDLTKPIELSVNPAAVMTRSLISSGNTTFEDNDAIGVYLGAPAADDNATALNSGRFQNVKRTYGSGGWSGNSIYWQSSTQKHTIYAYYPFTGTDGMAVADDKIAVSIAENQAANSGKGYKDADYMWKQSAMVPTNSAVTITLDHKMSLIKVTMQAGDGFTNLTEVAALTPAIHGTIYKGGSWSLTDGAITTTTDGSDNSFTSIKPYIENNASATSDASLTYYAIVMPNTTFSNGAKFISLTASDNTSYVYNLALNGGGNLVTAAGTFYDFKLTANKTGISLSSFNIGAWTSSGTTTEGNAEVEWGN